MNLRKRVLYISYDCITEPLTRSQVLPYLQALAVENDVFLMVFNKKRLGGRDLDEIRRRYGLRGIYALKYHKRPTLPATSFDILAGFLRSLVIVLWHKINLVHARSYVACSIALMVRTIARVPFIFDMRGLLGDERLDSGDWTERSLAYRAVKGLETSMLRDAAGIVVLSKRGAGVVAGLEPSAAPKIRVIPTCVATSLFRCAKAAREASGPVRMIYVGSLGSWYMLSEMLDFFAVFRTVAGAARFTLLTPSDAAMAQTLAAQKGVGDAVIIKNVLYEEVAGYLNDSDLSLFFIRPTYSKAASCPTKFAESLSTGTPVIANAGIGDIDYFINTHTVGVIVDGFNEAAYRAAAVRALALLRDDAGTAKRCRDLAEAEFSLESGVRKYKELYRTIP